MMLYGQTGAQWSTYRMGGPLDVVCQPDSVPEALEALTQACEKKMPITPLGWGSNTLIAEAGIRGMVFLTRHLTAISLHTEGPHVYWIDAGVHLAKVAQWCKQHALTGGEFFIGIPGTMGGAVRMNAGAMGQQTADVVCSVMAFNTLTGQVETLTAQQCGFSYRHSVFENRPELVVLKVLVAFQSAAQPEMVEQRMQANVLFRKAHHPTEPNGGSVFRNPSPEQPAGKLLDALGARQPQPWQEGAVSVSPLHANFIVNLGHGRAVEVLRLMLRMQQAVAQAYGYRLHPENVFIGQASPEEQVLWSQLGTQ